MRIVALVRDSAIDLAKTGQYNGDFFFELIDVEQLLASRIGKFVISNFANRRTVFDQIFVVLIGGQKARILSGQFLWSEARTIFVVVVELAIDAAEYRKADEESGKRKMTHFWFKTSRGRERLKLCAGKEYHIVSTFTI